MADRLDGTVALVTGAGSGIGEATARELAAQGAAAAVAARRRDRLDTVIDNAGVMLLGPAVGAPAEEWDRPEIREQAMERFRGVERLEAEDIADAIACVVTRPRRMAVHEMLVRPTQQEN